MDVVILSSLIVLVIVTVCLALLVLQSINSARRSVESAKDVMTDRTIQALNRIKESDDVLKKLLEQQESAQRLGESLKDLLQGPKLRGNYGEVILEEMLERILPRGIWQRQYLINGNERVDCVVLLREIIVPIDAKFPRDDYMRYVESESKEESSYHWKAFENAVKRQINDIQKKYIKPESGTSEFALMFIPSEAIYYETIAEENHLGDPTDILEYAQNHRVFPVSPNTFYAFLQVVVLAIRNVEIIRSAKKLQQSLTDLERSFDRFYAKYQDMGKRINQAAEAYRIGDDHVQRYRQRVNATLQLQQTDNVEIVEPTKSEESEQSKITNQ